MECRDSFLECMADCRLMDISYISKKHGDAIITRTCAPWDIGPNSRAKDQSVHYYWVVDVSSPSGTHLTPISPTKIVDAVALTTSFDPAEFVAAGLRLGPFYVDRDW